MQLLILSKKHLAMSRAEVLALYDAKQVSFREHYAFVDSSKKHYERLAFCKEVYNVAFSCSKKALFSRVASFNWKKVIGNKKYMVRSSFSERKIADAIWENLTSPKVDLKKPEVIVSFFVIGTTVYCGTLAWSNTAGFTARKAHMRPGFSPVSLDPQLARAMVNLSGVGKGVVVDPFCGTGGILLEAGLLGIRSYGYDISERMLAASRKNIAHLKLKNVKVTLGNALTYKKKSSAVVTEIPFGRNTNVANIKELFFSFLSHATKNTSTIVVSVPDSLSLRGLTALGWTKKHAFTWYIHKSLSKKVLVLTR